MRRPPGRSGSSGAQERYATIAFAYEAAVANDNCIRLGGLKIDVPATKRRPSYAKARVLVKQHLDGRWTVHYQAISSPGTGRHG